MRLQEVEYFYSIFGIFTNYGNKTEESMVAWESKINLYQHQKKTHQYKSNGKKEIRDWEYCEASSTLSCSRFSTILLAEK